MILISTFKKKDFQKLNKNERKPFFLQIKSSQVIMCYKLLARRTQTLNLKKNKLVFFYREIQPVNQSLKIQNNSSGKEGTLILISWHIIP